EVLSPWWNAYKFFIENAGRFEREKGTIFSNDEDIHRKVSNVMDRWILSELQSLISFVRTEMEGYRLYTVVPELLRFIDKLCNWYVRMNRPRLRGQESYEDAEASLTSLYHVLLNLCQLMAPLTPFVVESMYLNLRGALGNDSEKSVHFLPIPSINEKAIDKDIERRIRNLQSVIELGRNVRVTSRLKVKVPLIEAIIVHQDKQFLEDIKGLSEYVKSELNCKDVKFSNELTDYITLTAEPVHKELGSAFKEKKQEITAALKTMKHEQLLEFSNTGSTRLCGEEIKLNMVNIIWNFTGDQEKYGASSGKGALVILNKHVSREMELQGLAREVANRIQKLRKKGGITPADNVTVYYSVEDQKSDIAEVLRHCKGDIEKITRVRVVPKHYKSDKIGNITEEVTEVNSFERFIDNNLEKVNFLFVQFIHLYLCKPQVYFQPGALEKYDEKIRQSIELYVHSIDYSTFKDKYSKVGSKIYLTIDSHAATLESGADFVFDFLELKEAKAVKQ
ncbi:isoleucyl-tRNA synthetase, partial [Reticulomyxa filosa]